MTGKQNILQLRSFHFQVNSKQHQGDANNFKTGQNMNIWPDLASSIIAMTHDHYHGHHGDDDDCEYFRAKIVEWSSRVFIGYRKSMARRKHSYYLNIKFFLEMIKRAVIVNDRTQSISHIRFCPHLSRQKSLNANSSFYNLKAEDS